MDRTLAPTTAPKLLLKVRTAAPFWLCLLLSLWFVADSVRDPLLGIAGAVPLLPALLMIGLAFALLLLRGDEAPACLLALYMSTLAVLARDNTAGILEPFLTRRDLLDLGVNYRAVHIVWTLALGGVPLYFGWIYTEQDRVERPPLVKHLVTLCLFLCSGLGTVACGLLALHSQHSPIPLDNITRNLPSPYHRLLIYAAPMLLAQHAAAFWLLLRHYRRWGEARNHALVLVFGLALLFVASVIINDTLARLETCVLSNLAASAVALMLVSALERHALFDIRIFIRRTVQYALARQTLNLLTLAPIVVLAFLWGLWLQHDPAQPVQMFRDGLFHNGAALCLGTSLFFGVMLVLRAPLLRHFDRAYFREIYDAQQVLGEVGRSLLGVTDPRIIARATLEGIDSVLHPVNAMLLCEEGGHVACLAQRNYSGYRPPLWPDPALLAVDQIREVGTLQRPSTSRRVSWTDTLPAPARALLEEAQIRLIVPLREEDKTTGVLLLGEKASGMVYSPEDIEILRALASQTALAMQSARLNREFLRRSTSELKAGSVGFVELVERERRLLAADLHDQTLPELRCLLADLQSLADTHDDLQAAGCSGPEQMAEHLRQTIENIRDIMESLRPSALEMLGLLPALENELRKATARSRPPLVPQFQVLEETRPQLSAFAEMSVFRIVQEAVNNACRHAGASKVRVQIGVEDAEWVVRVDDDGIGLSALKKDEAEGERRLPDAGHAPPPGEERRRGRGLDNMQYRASLIGARIAWGVPDWGQGTSVGLRLPLHPPAS
ncbi:MAG TPA: ATP-binding protein [Chthonomonadaceae bacterium]|nr:ATP-binding protein [Chthonomonadaceae bacterium]